MGVKKRSKLAEINITPLVDVMLVLLVIFMVVSPSMHSDIKVKVPVIRYVDAKNAVDLKDSVQIILSADELKINEKKVVITNFTSELANFNKDFAIYLKADEKLSYNEVFAVLNKIVAAGFGTIYLVGVVQK